MDKGEYKFLGFADIKSFMEPGEKPKSTYKCLGSATQAQIYVKDGKYYYDWFGTILPVEENPYYGDTTLGVWGTFKYRYKVVLKTKKYNPQGWTYHYLNLP